MEGRIGVGVVGCGGISRVHLRNLSARDDVDLILTCDLNEERARENCSEFGAKGYVADYQALLADERVQAILCLVPQGFHSEICTAAALVGKHIFCEKPMAMSLAECRAMRKAAEKTGVVLQIGHVLRFSPDILRVKQWLDSGYIGRPVLFRDMWAPSPWGSPYPWVFDRKTGGGPLFENAHWIDFMNFLLGRPTRVYASLNYFKPDGGTAADTILIVVDYEFGDKAVWSDAWCLPGFSWDTYYVRHNATRSHFDIIGPKGSIHFPAADGSRRASLYVTSHGRQPVEVYEWEADWGGRASAYQAELGHFLECVRTGRKPMCSGEEGEWAIQVAEAAYISNALGQSVQLPLTQIDLSAPALA